MVAREMSKKLLRRRVDTRKVSFSKFATRALVSVVFHLPADAAQQYFFRK